LFSILADKTEADDTATVVDIFRVVILKSLHMDKDGWILLDESTSLLYPFGDRVS
jgi:hypothetical protein